MKIAVVGGGLQGLETVYLACKAGWHATLVDRKADPPARGLCHRFRQIDVADDNSVTEVFKHVDVVFPALENQAALDALVRQTEWVDVPLAFDPRAYAVTCSKKASNRLFTQLDLPQPDDAGLPDAPVIVKPSEGSGSREVCTFASRDLAQTFLDQRPSGESWICQQYLTGPTFSIEVLGRPGAYHTFAVTDLFMDDVYDCKRVRAPSTLSPAYQKQLADMALRLADALNLTGLMDVEVVYHQDRLYLLEIDARIPSQTPTAVYWSSGINMIDWLGRLFTDGEMPVERSVRSGGAMVYEHVRVASGQVETRGEHMMTQAGPLRLVTDFYGCDEAITDFSPDNPDWTATLVCCGSDDVRAWRKRSAVLDHIRSAVLSQGSGLARMGGRG